MIHPDDTVAGNGDVSLSPRIRAQRLRLTGRKIEQPDTGDRRAAAGAPNEMTVYDIVAVDRRPGKGLRSRYDQGRITRQGVVYHYVPIRQIRLLFLPYDVTSRDLGESDYRESGSKVTGRGTLEVSEGNAALGLASGVDGKADPNDRRTVNRRIIGLCGSTGGDHGVSGAGAQIHDVDGRSALGVRRPNHLGAGQGCLKAVPHDDRPGAESEACERATACGRG